MKYSITNTLSLMLLCGVLLFSYQNCGQVGGSSLSSFYTGPGDDPTDGSLGSIPDSDELAITLRDQRFNRHSGEISIEFACSGSTYDDLQIRISVTRTGYNDIKNFYSTMGHFSCSPSTNISSLPSNTVNFLPKSGYNSQYSYNISLQIFGLDDGLHTNTNTAIDQGIIPEGYTSPDSFQIAFYTSSSLQLSSGNDYINSLGQIPAPHTNPTSEGYAKLTLSWEILPETSTFNKEFHEVFTVLNEAENSPLLLTAINPIMNANDEIINWQFGVSTPFFNILGGISNSAINAAELFITGKTIRYDYEIDCTISTTCLTRFTIRDVNSRQIIYAMNQAVTPYGRVLARDGLRLIAGRHEQRSIYPAEPSGWRFQNIQLCLQSFNDSQALCN